MLILYLSVFVVAVDTYGLPSRIHTDKGGEDVLVASCVLSHPDHGPGRDINVRLACFLTSFWKTSETPLEPPLTWCSGT